MIELLAPVGNAEMLAAAIDAGADAVYFGTKVLNMRANAQNFELSELKKVVAKCHEHSVKAYLTVNVIIFPEEIDMLCKVLDAAKDAGIDAVICWDMAVFKHAKERGIPIHLSTQASISNAEGVARYLQEGASCFVLARELSLAQIKKIKEEMPAARLEAFIHGAMCISISGRCFMSQHLFGRSANRGDCIQPCRRAYTVTDVETGDALAVDNQYIMSAKDLCTLPFIDKIIASGVEVLKIEGRNKGPEYVKTVVAAYRKAIDLHAAGKLDEKKKEELLQELKTAYNRKFSSGFYLGLPTADDITDVYGNAGTKKKEYVGYVRKFYQKISVAEIKLESGKIEKGQTLLFTGKTTGAQEMDTESLQIEGLQVARAEKGALVAVKIDFQARPKDKVFVLTSS